ncbi:MULTISPECIES: pyruvate dehydrogenase (acetyl-transferring) E1 component subunit alpha [Kordiimonas]|uniref:pyruvate dehydrogenase (acetyl-transferring) E1 component subunit alpha n=1 Tax=Kordiimonas TaxID=288021 RepID=UPI00257CD9C1|nr:pyruvate dehydrogenase (acetyl-transferring) E1 component subunit alpha [Kordiimonas sp. UBA4487]
MPQIGMKPNDPVPVLSVLNQDGALDETLEPDLSEDTLHRMYRTMLEARLFDERLLNLQRQGKLGTFAPVRGQEAAQVGSISALEEDDWMVPSFRENAAALWRGTPMDGLFLFIAGYNEGLAIPDGKKDLPVAVPVASQLPHAVGLAYAEKFRKTDNVAMVYFGDGATSEGDFHEALNFAGVMEVPVVFVCQNNQWAISVPREKQTASHSIAQKAHAYGIQGIQVDGNDVLAVHAATRDAVERARNEHKPTLIECVTYRMEVHTTADDPTIYRDDEDVEAWEERDPIERMRGYLIGKDIWSDDQEEELCDSIQKEIKNAWAKTQETIKGLDDPRVIFDHVFDEPTHLIKEQRARFEQDLQSGRDADE